MAGSLSYNIFPILPEVATNDSNREGSLMLEYFQVAVDVNTDVATAEVPTVLGEVLGVISLGYTSLFDTGDIVSGFATDGVITDDKVTIRATTVSIANGTAKFITRGFLVGKKSTTVLS